MKALILVDLQKDFLPGGALAVPHGDEVIAVANRVQHNFTLVVATRDWHPENHGSFAANHRERAPGEIVKLNGLDQILWPTHCVQNREGADFADGLETARIVETFYKGTDPEIDSYSGFFDNGRRKATGLGEYLRERKVTEVYVLGLATDYCVKETALDAIGLGFVTYLIADGCRGVELKAGDINRALNEMRLAGVKIVTSDDLLITDNARPMRPATMKFRKRLIVVEATQWNAPGDHAAVVHPVPNGVPIVQNGKELEMATGDRADLPLGAIKTLEGWMLVRPGDYVIRGVQGEHYACKPDVFVKTYEPLAAPGSMETAPAL